MVSVLEDGTVVLVVAVDDKRVAMVEDGTDVDKDGTGVVVAAMSVENVTRVVVVVLVVVVVVVEEGRGTRVVKRVEPADSNLVDVIILVVGRTTDPDVDDDNDKAVPVAVTMVRTG